QARSDRTRGVVRPPPPAVRSGLASDCRASLPLQVDTRTTPDKPLPCAFAPDGRRQSSVDSAILSMRTRGCPTYTQTANAPARPEEPGRGDRLDTTPGSHQP